MTASRDRVQARSTPTELPGARRFGGRLLLGLVGLVIGAVPFLALLLLVQDSWPPLAGLDGGVAAQLNADVAGRPLVVQTLRLVTDGGGTGTAVYVLVLATAWLLIRRQRRLAVYVAVTGMGLAVLVPASKVLVGRERPDVLLPVVAVPSNASFPSGHAMTSLVTWGVLLLLVLPAVRRRWRRPLVAATVLYVVAIGFTRLALGVHFVTDVAAGWTLGAGWLLTTTAVFRGWQHDQGRPIPPLSSGLTEEPAGPPARAVDTGAAPAGTYRRTAVRLALGWLAVFTALGVLGLLVTQVLDTTAVGRFDAWAVRALLEQRTGTRTSVVQAVNALSGTRAVVLLAVAQAVLALAVTRSWRPVVFIAVAVLGEVALYAAVAQVVGRPRPGVPDLTSQLPVGASFPSGHVAAAAVIYGTLAVLVLTYGRSPLRRVVLALPVLLVPAISLGRVYVAAHHPTDVLAGALLGLAWLIIVTRLVLPAPPLPGPARAAPAIGTSDPRRPRRADGPRSSALHTHTSAPPTTGTC